MHTIMNYQRDPYTSNLVVTKRGISEIIPLRAKTVGGRNEYSKDMNICWEIL